MNAPAAGGFICAWCGKPVRVGGGHMRLVQARSVAQPGVWRSMFHVSCAREILTICETRPLEKPVPAAMPDAMVMRTAPRTAPQRARPTASAAPAAVDLSPRPSDPAPPPTPQTAPAAAKPRATMTPTSRARAERRVAQRQREAEQDAEWEAERRRLVASAAAPEIRDLAGRGFKPNQIAARLRVPYAAVHAALEEL